MPNVKICPRDLWSSSDEACLAVLAMPSPEGIMEYGLNPYNYFKDIIKRYQEKKMALSDRDLVFIAWDCADRMSIGETRYFRERTLALRDWPWLVSNVEARQLGDLRELSTMYGKRTTRKQ